MIYGQRVTLRPIAPADREYLRRWQASPVITREWGLPGALLPHDAFERELEGQFREFDSSGSLVIDTETGPVGRIDFNHLDARHGTVEIDVYIGELATQRRAYAIDAIRTLVNYLFRQRGMNRIEATVPSANRSVMDIYREAGFTDEGLFRDQVVVEGVFQDQTLMALHADAVQRDRAH